MKKTKPEQRAIYIAKTTFIKLQKAFHRMALKSKGKMPKKSEFYTNIIERGLRK